MMHLSLSSQLKKSQQVKHLIDISQKYLRSPDCMEDTSLQGDGAGRAGEEAEEVW